jgi:hypothetical protein
MDDFNDVLIEAVKAAGGSKKVGQTLWPDMPVDKAQRRLLDALNPEREAKISPTQVLLVMRSARACGWHGAMDWLCTALGYAPTTPVSVGDETEELQRQFVEATAQLGELMKRMERLNNIQPTRMKVVG